MKLKFVNYTSLLALVLSQSSPLLSMMGDDSEDNIASRSTAPKENSREAWEGALFIKKVFHFGSKLILENLKREIIGVSFQALKDPNNLQNNEKKDRLIAVMDQESNAHPEDESLYKFLFNLYSGEMLKVSVFIDQAKAKALLDQACNQRWGWSFWERAKRSREHAQGQLSRDHYMSLNYGIAPAIQYCTSHASQSKYSRAKAEQFFRQIANPKAKIRDLIQKFVQEWLEIGFAQPFVDATEAFDALPSAGKTHIRKETLKSLKEEFLNHAISLGHQRIIGERINNISERLSRVPEAKLAAHEGLLRELTDLGSQEGLYSLARLYSDKNKEEAIRFLLLGAHRGNVVCMETLGVTLSETHPEEALDWTRKAADRGNEDAIFQLATSLNKTNPDESERLLRILVEKQHPEAMNHLGVLLRHKDPVQALELFQRAAELGEPESMNNVGLLSEESDPAKALIYFERSANAGSPGGMNNYAAKIMHDQPKKAEKLFRQAAALHYSEAMVNLFIVLKDHNFKEAKAWLKKSAEAENHQGLVMYALVIEEENPAYAKDLLFKALKKDSKKEAMRALGDIYYREGNLLESEKMYRSAAELDDVSSMTNLAILLKHKNREEAKEWARKAVDRGSVDAMNVMGCILTYDGDPESFNYFLQAAKLGSIEAMVNLGRYFNDKDPNQARHWFLKAALLDHVNAMGALGYNFMCQGNLDEAHFWLEKASALGDQKSSDLLRAIQKISPVSAPTITQDLIEAPTELDENDDLENAFDAFNEKSLSSEINQSQVQDYLVKEQKPEVLSSDDEASGPVGVDFEPVKIDGEPSGVDSAQDVEPKLSNPKTKRELARELAFQRKKIGQVEQEKLTLSAESQTLVNQILSNDADQIQKENLVRLFSDPYFLNQVRVVDTKSGFSVIAHNRFKNQHITTGAHRKHGKEKYTGRIHPETLKDVKDILTLFDVVKK